jgi:hypothetical protein
LINNGEINTDFPHEDLTNNDNIIYDNNENNTREFPSTVTTVTTVTNENLAVNQSESGQHLM